MQLLRGSEEYMKIIHIYKCGMVLYSSVTMGNEGLSFIIYMGALSVCILFLPPEILTEKQIENELY